MFRGGVIQAAILDAWSVISPVSCAGCGADDRALCAACRASLVAHPRRHLIGAEPLEVTSALDYDGAVRRAVLAFKEEARTDIATVLAVAFREAIITAAGNRGGLGSGQPGPVETWPVEPGLGEAGPVELVAIPPSRSSLRARGYDPVSVLLARARLPRAAPVLMRSRSTQSQKTLNRESRRTNLMSSLRASYPLDNRRFLLIDDVVTTGATLIEAARAIADASGIVMGAATLAATPQRFGN